MWQARLSRMPPPHNGALMAISLKPKHLKRYKDIALLVWKYGRKGLGSNGTQNELLLLVDLGRVAMREHSIGRHALVRLAEVRPRDPGTDSLDSRDKSCEGFPSRCCFGSARPRPRPGAL